MNMWLSNRLVNMLFRPDYREEQLNCNDNVASARVGSARCDADTETTCRARTMLLGIPVQQTLHGESGAQQDAGRTSRSSPSRVQRLARDVAGENEYRAADGVKRTIRREGDYTRAAKEPLAHLGNMSSRVVDTDVVFRVLYERGFFCHRRNENTLLRRDRQFATSDLGQARKSARSNIRPSFGGGILRPGNGRRYRGGKPFTKISGE